MFATVPAEVESVIDHSFAISTAMALMALGSAAILEMRRMRGVG